MEKKIIAIVGVVLLLVSVFAACAKKPTITGNNGIEYAVVTDDEGNTVLNDNGEVAVYVTDEHGKYVKDSNGEKQTNYIEFTKKIISGNTFETADYAITMPDDWTLSQAERYTKNDTDGTVTIKMVDFGELESGQSLESKVGQIVEENNAVLNEIKEELEKENVSVNTTVTDAEITEKKVPAKVIDILYTNSEGNAVLHAHGTYYICNGKLFKIEYVCGDSQFDDTSDEIIALINDSFTIKGVIGR